MKFRTAQSSRLSLPKLSALALGAGLLLLNAAPAPAIQEVVSDVCVYGGTSGGVIAAVQAARLGKTVALVVVNTHLGGMTSGGLGQTDIGGYGDGYIQGVAREFYTRVGQKYGLGIKFTFEPHVAETVFNEMAQEAGIAVYTNQSLVSVTRDGPQLIALTMDTGDIFRARMFIDATYEGDLMAKAGVTYTLGRETATQYGESLNGVRPPNSGGHQFGSLTVDPYVVAGDPASGLLPLVQSNSAPAAGSADQRLQAYNFRMCLTQNATNRLPITAPPGYDSAQFELLARYIQALVARGTTPTLGTFMNISSMPNGKTDINNNGAVSTDFIGGNYDYPEADAATRRDTWQAHKNYIQGLYYFLGTDGRVPAAVRSQMQAYGLAKDEFTDNGGWPYQLYVREARRMVSGYVMTQSNCLGQVIAPDSIGLGAYNMDSHNCQRIVVGGFAQNEGDVQVGTGGPYPISYRSIVSAAAECGNLLVPWCLSASHIAFGSIRMEPVFMILGQATATAACLALDDAVPVQNLSLMKLQGQLTADRQALGPGNSFNPDNGIIVDNADPAGVTIVGGWTASSSTAGYYARDYLHDGNSNKGLSSVTFTPTLPQAGPYQVFSRWTAHSNRGTNVPIDVTHAAGTNTFAVNQTQQGGQWVLLLTTNFNAGASGKVAVRNTGTYGYVIADAVRFVPLNSLPTVNLWASDASASRWGPQPGAFTVSRSGDTNLALTVDLNIGGSVVNGVDYSLLDNSVTFPPGVAFANITVNPIANGLPVGNRTLTLSLATNATYSVGGLASASITLYDQPLFAWRLQFFGVNATNAAVAGDAANPAGDGIPNLIKYALGLDPTQPAPGPLLTPGFDTNGFFALSYSRPDPPPADINYQIEVSSNLVTWCTNSSCALVEQILLSSNHTTATVTWRDTLHASAASERFLRLRVTRK